MKSKKGVINSRLGRDKKDRKKVAVMKEDDLSGKIAIPIMRFLKNMNFYLL